MTNLQISKREVKIPPQNARTWSHYSLSDLLVAKPGSSPYLHRWIHRFSTIFFVKAYTMHLIHFMNSVSSSVIVIFNSISHTKPQINRCEELTRIHIHIHLYSFHAMETDVHTKKYHQSSIYLQLLSKLFFLKSIYTAHQIKRKKYTQIVNEGSITYRQVIEGLIQSPTSYSDNIGYSEAFFS